MASCSAYHSAGDPVGLDQPRPLRAAARPGRPALLVAQLDAELLRQPLDGLGEPEPVDLHHELDDVAARPAAEAVVDPADGVTLKLGDFSSWKGHRPFMEPPPALRRVT